MQKSVTILTFIGIITGALGFLMFSMGGGIIGPFAFIAPYAPGLIFGAGVAMYFHFRGAGLFSRRSLSLFVLGSCVAWIVAYHVASFVLQITWNESNYRLSLWPFILAGAVGGLLLSLSFSRWVKKLLREDQWTFVIVCGMLGAAGSFSLPALFVLWQAVAACMFAIMYNKSLQVVA
ncbi:MAG: hypothetical protein KBD16_04345 [Candidatus Pacebacteria bacterium]|nr:hypothetical protein [Candidatus Paceibacterota bacterium]